MYSLMASQQVFTVYAGLTASGYGLAHPPLDGPIEHLIREITAAHWSQEVLAFFRQARTDRCEVNPYWPRASLLTLASLYLPDSPPYRVTDPQQLISRVQALDMISPEEKDEYTLRWLLQLPEAYTSVRAHAQFSRFWHRYADSINLVRCADVVRETEKLITERLGVAPEQLPKVVILPNPLQASEVADFVKLNDVLYVIQAEPDITACVHELLHHIFSTALKQQASVITQFYDLFPRVRQEMFRMGYAWDDSAASWHNVFEDHFMRAAGIWLSHDDPVKIREAAAFQAQFGFTYTPILTRCFQTEWSGINNLAMFLQTCLCRCREDNS